MDYARHEGRMRQPVEGSTGSQREHLAALVERMNSPAHARLLKELDGPPFPEDLGYLWVWVMELDRARRVGPHGLEGFSYQEIEAWARLTDRDPQPHEIAALLDLDAVLRFPGAGERVH